MKEVPKSLDDKERLDKDVEGLQNENQLLHKTNSDLELRISAVE